MSEHKVRDPGDTEAYLRLNNWTEITEFDGIDGKEGSTYYFQILEEQGEKAMIIVELTAGNRRKFYLEDPPEVVRAAAHGGDCLTSRGIADGEVLHRLHFKTRPNSIADGVRIIRQMLRGET